MAEEVTARLMTGTRRRSIGTAISAGLTARVTIGSPCMDSTVVVMTMVVGVRVRPDQRGKDESKRQRCS